MNFVLHDFHIQIRVTRIAHVHYFEFTHDYATAPDSHPFHELVYIDSGHMAVESENFRGRLEEGQMILHSPNETHALHCDCAANVIIIGFRCDSERLAVFGKRSTPLSEQMRRLLAQIVKEGRNVFSPPYDIPNQRNMTKRETYPFGADQLIKNLLEYFLIKLLRNEETDAAAFDEDAAGGDSPVYEIRDYLDRNVGKRTSLNELCLLFGTNKTTLCREFRRLTGDTVVDYCNKLRMKEAKKRIREGGETFSRIAEDLNFSSIHYFTRLFIQYEGLTPTQYLHSIKSKLES